MGVMRFLVHPAEALEDWDEAHRAYISGLDARVFPTRIEIDGSLMSCRRKASGSGKLHVAWPVPGFGRPLLSTTSLSERDEPYVLAVELARGKIAKVRDQYSAWEIAGMQTPEEFRQPHREAYRLFSRAALIQSEQPEEASRLAIEALTHACEAANILTQTYTRQRLFVRRRRAPRLPASLGCNLGPVVPEEAAADQFCQAFNAACVPVDWRSVEPAEGVYNWDTFDAQVEWCDQHKLLMRGGPLLDFSPGGLPDWLEQWEHDLFNLESFVSDFVETAISRYVGRIRLWEVSSRVNTGGALALTEENRLTLVAKTLETARQIDDDIQLFIRVDQPWGDYQARGQHRLSPLQFVDALVRSGVGLSGVDLELAVGYRPQNSASRDLLDLSQLLDHWSVLGIPLHVTLAFPSSGAVDPLATSDLEVNRPQWKADWSDAAQAQWIEMFLPLLMAKQSVVGIFWAHFSDAAAHQYPHAGLLDAAGRPKPALDQITTYRRTYWKADDDS
jgi:GH35 family endo-1,4-beta-xylanase